MRVCSRSGSFLLAEHLEVLVDRGASVAIRLALSEQLDVSIPASLALADEFPLTDELGFGLGQQTELVSRAFDSENAAAVAVVTHLADAMVAAQIEDDRRASGGFTFQVHRKADLRSVLGEGRDNVLDRAPEVA